MRLIIKGNLETIILHKLLQENIITTSMKKQILSRNSRSNYDYIFWSNLNLYIQNNGANTNEGQPLSNLQNFTMLSLYTIIQFSISTLLLKLVPQSIFSFSFSWLEKHSPKEKHNIQSLPRFSSENAIESDLELGIPPRLRVRSGGKTSKHSQNV